MGREKRILLVEDDVALCDATSIGLNRRGYEVSGFVDPAAARAAFEHDPGSWDLVITDHNMPGLTGAELVQIVKTRRRDLPVILWSSAGAAGFERLAAGSGADSILYKPVETGVLVTEVEQLLDRTAEESRS